MVLHHPQVTVDSVPTVNIVALTTVKSNPSKKITLTGVIDPADLAVEGSWSLVSGALSTGGLGAVATTSLTSEVAAGVSGTSYLVLPAGSLTAGATYQFQLSATYAGVSDATSGYSALTVIVNSPPSSGLLEVIPAVGEVLSTAFEFACSGTIVDTFYATFSTASVFTWPGRDCDARRLGGRRNRLAFTVLVLLYDCRRLDRVPDHI